MPAPTSIRQRWADLADVFRPKITEVNFEDRETLERVCKDRKCYFMAVGGKLEPDQETARTVTGTAKVIFGGVFDVRIGDVLELKCQRWKVYNVKTNALFAVQNTEAWCALLGK